MRREGVWSWVGGGCARWGGLAGWATVMLLAGCSRSSAPEAAPSGGAPPSAPASESVAIDYPVSDVTLEALMRAGGDMDKASAPGAVLPPAPVSRAVPTFDIALTEVLKQYYTVRKLLAADTHAGVAEAASALRKALEQAGAGQLPATNAEDTRAVDQALKDIDKAAADLAGAADLKADRAAFGRLTTPLLYLVTFFYHADIEKQPIVYYCPMKKLAWMQDVRAMGNPYYGSSMLTCGMTVPRAAAAKSP